MNEATKKDMEDLALHGSPEGKRLAKAILELAAVPASAIDPNLQAVMEMSERALDRSDKRVKEFGERLEQRRAQKG